MEIKNKILKIKEVLKKAGSWGSDSIERELIITQNEYIIEMLEEQKGEDNE